MVDVAVIIVGIDSQQYVENCLRSLTSADWRDYSYQVVYVDNASSDDSVNAITTQFPEVRILANASNVGFCRACNQAAAAVDSRYIYLLNNDTIVLQESVSKLVDFLDQTPDAAAAANRLLNEDRTDQWSGRRFPTWSNAIFGRRTLFGRLFPNSWPIRRYLYKDELGSCEPFSVDWIPGSCTLVRRKAFCDAGRLPEHMHYWSDAVFCDRLSKAGWKVYVVPTAPLVHYEGKGTGGQTSAVRCWLISDFHKGAYAFFCEHYELSRWSLTRMAARFGLGLRARLLITLDRLTSRA